MSHPIKTISRKIEFYESDRNEAHIAQRKFVNHIIWILVGIVVSIALSFIPHVGLFAYPVAGIPSLGLEIIDRIFKW